MSEEKKLLTLTISPIYFGVFGNTVFLYLVLIYTLIFIFICQMLFILQAHLKYHYL